MALKFMDPEITKKILEGREDVLTPLIKEDSEFYKNQNCPYCASTSLVKIGDSTSMFRGDGIMPKYFLRCSHCGCNFDPHSKLILTTGNLGKAVGPAIPILDNSED